LAVDEPGSLADASMWRWHQTRRFTVTFGPVDAACNSKLRGLCGKSQGWVCRHASSTGPAALVKPSSCPPSWSSDHRLRAPGSACLTLIKAQHQPAILASTAGNRACIIAPTTIFERAVSYQQLQLHRKAKSNRWRLWSRTRMGVARAATHVERSLLT